MTLSLQKNTRPILWFHCASLGEYEQGLPIIERLQKNHPQYQILLTFFSPSGYEVIEKKELNTLIFYLPLDTKSQASKFINLVKPKIAFFIKYEFWYNYLSQLQENGIPCFLIAGVFREDQWFFHFYGKWLFEKIKGFNLLFVQNEQSLFLLEKYNLKNVLVVGDTRIDRVTKIQATIQPILPIEHFKRNNKLFIFGSTHVEDEDIIIPFINSIIGQARAETWCFLLVPHDVHSKNIERIKKKLDSPVIPYSNVPEQTFQSSIKIMILDVVGVLKKVYQYSDLTYIGGGFSDGIHNILEPAAFGNPILIGPNYQTFQEGKDLVERGGVFVLNNENSLLDYFQQFQNFDNRRQVSKINKAYLSTHEGATNSIMAYLEDNDLL